MVRSIRVKDYIFDASVLVASAGGNIGAFTDHSINGTIQKIQIGPSNYTATGSLLFTASGTGETIFSFVSGAAPRGNVAGSPVNYLFSYMVDSAGNSGSPQAVTQRVVNSPIQLIGSGLGNAKSGLFITISYI